MSLGLAPVMVDQLLEILRQIHAAGVGIVMVEQDVETALEFSSRAYVLETGRIGFSGASAECSMTRASARPISASEFRRWTNVTRDADRVGHLQLRPARRSTIGLTAPHTM